MVYDFEKYKSQKLKDILCECYKIKEVKVFSDNRFENITPFYQSTLPFKKKLIFNAPFQYYYSPQLNNIEEDFFNGLEDYSKKNGKNILVKSFYEYQYKNRIQIALNSTLRLDYEDYNKYIASLSKNFRQNLRTAANKVSKEQFTLKFIDTDKELKDFYVKLSRLYIKKHKMVFQPFKLYEKFYKAGIAKYLIFKNEEGEVIACIVLIRDGKLMHYNWGITDVRYYKFSLNSLLIDELIKYCFKHDIEAIDFGSTPESDKDLLFFKEKWGCSHSPVYEYYTAQKPNAIDLNNSYLAMRNLYSLLPPSLIRPGMPFIIPWLVS